MCEQILRVKPDIIITEKGVLELALHYLQTKGNCPVFHRFRKNNNNRVARATGATIVNSPEKLLESDVGKNCGLFAVQKIGYEYCKNLRN
jgi:T-complex protein 1 subunit gamma